jgi:hypothetical protein
MSEVDARGATVMPFDLTRTQHSFQSLHNGGLEQVLANDGNDAQQIGLIRQHLRMEADRFRQGDFSDPATIHGTDMPGLTELQAGAARLQIDYSDLSNGAQIRYTSDDPVLVAAIHDWFTAQDMDHNGHSMQP